MSKKVAVVGGGVSGLAAAHRVLELSHGEADVTLYEASGRLGGVVATARRDGFTFEKGPDSFLSEKTAAVDLCRRLGIEKRLISTRPDHRRSFVVREHKLVPVPNGFYLVAPTDTASFLKSPLFSWPGKWRIYQERFIPARRDPADETIGAFVRRRFGKENLERVGQPMLAGIYTGDPEELSLRSTLPRLKKLEETYGSVTKGLRAAKAERLASGPRYSLFLSFDEGMEVLTDTLAQKIPLGKVRLNVPVDAIRFEAGEWEISSRDSKEKVDAVILALPAFAAGPLLRPVSPSLAALLTGIRYESVATLNLGFRRENIRHALDGFGFVVPKTEPFSITACTFASQKFERRSPEGLCLLRAFLGGAFHKEALGQDDASLIDGAVRELSRLLGIQGEPLFQSLERYPRSMVQYRLGHPELVEKIRAEAARFPGLSLVGPATGGIGIPDCIEEAQDQAEKIHLSFTHKRKKTP